MTKQTFKSGTVSDLYLKLLADRGIDYLIANAGTDFASIIESFAKAEAEGTKVPTPIIATHENVAVSMAHGFYLATGKPQAVMVHVNVGTANALCGLLNAAKDNVPIIFTAGRTPYTETGMTGSRAGSIHWAQEMFDQAGMVREAVKWDYELKNGEQVEAVIDRAIEIAMAEPRGPVYITLPREVLATEISNISYESPARRAPVTKAYPDESALEQTAELLANSDRPLILTRTVGRDKEASAALADFCEKHAIPVAEFRPVYSAMPSQHPMNLGYDVPANLEVADVVLALDAVAPWLPRWHGNPPEDSKVIHIGPDPLFPTYPIRGFPRDLAIESDLTAAIQGLDQILSNGMANDAKVAARRERIGELQAKRQARISKMREEHKNSSPIHPAWASYCLTEALDDDALIFNDYPLLLPHMNLKNPCNYFGSPEAGGLGWGTGAAIGAKLGAPDRTVVCAMGDGSYIFGNPMAAHQVVASNGLPMLFCIFNNSTWFAVRRATLDVYPDGFASKSNRMPLTMLEPSPHFEKIMDLFGGYGEKVERAEDLPGAFERALNAIHNEKRQALLNIIVSAAW